MNDRRFLCCTIQDQLCKSDQCNGKCTEVVELIYRVPGGDTIYEIGLD